MKKTFKKIVTAVVAGALLLTSVLGLASCGKTNYAENNTKIKIGVSGPLTGAAAVYGVAVKNAAQMAVDEINAKGGLDGMMFELVMTDDKHDATNIANNYATLYEGGMQISLGTVTTKPCLEFKEFANDDHVFFLTPSASGDDVPEYENGFQMCFADSNQGAASANYFNDNYKGKTVGIFYQSDDEYSTGILAKFEEALDSSFGTVAKASFKEGDSDFASQVQTLKNCDVIFMPIYYTPASQFMVAGKNVVKANAVYYGCDGLDGIDAIDGFDINSITQEVSYLSHFNSNATTGAAADFIAAYNAKYDEAAEPLNQFGAAAYDCVYAIYEALKVAQTNGKQFDVTTSPSDFCDILTEVFASDSFVFHGVTGEATESGKSNISWSADGTVNKVAVKYVVKEASAN